MQSTLIVPFEVKFSAGDALGVFGGYGAVFGNEDANQDAIAPGAFKVTLAKLKAEGRAASMYMQHGPLLGGDPRPVGVWTQIEEDDRGLAVKGKLVGMDTETGKFNYALVKEGAMKGLSIGFKTRKADYPKDGKGPRRILKEIDLFEISIVDQPANALALVDSIKSVDDMTEREFERLLMRDAGFSRSEALHVINKGFKSLQAMRDAGGDEIAQLATLLKSAGMYA